MITVDEDCLREKLHFFKKKVQDISACLISPVIVDQVKVINISHQESVLFIPAAVG